MVRLARRYGLSRVAQVLRVNYTALKHHLVATAAPQAPPSGAIAAEFVEVPMSACPSSQWVITGLVGTGRKLVLGRPQVLSAARVSNQRPDQYEEPLPDPRFGPVSF
jgi:hypothetical protein